jgi:hypothetical protein
MVGKAAPIGRVEGKVGRVEDRVGTAVHVVS